MRSLKSSPKPINYHVLNFGSHRTAGFLVIMYSYVVLIKISNIKMLKQKYKEIISIIYFLISIIVGKII